MFYKSSHLLENKYMLFFYSIHLKSKSYTKNILIQFLLNLKGTKYTAAGYVKNV